MIAQSAQQLQMVAPDERYNHNNTSRRRKRLDASRIRVDLDADHPDIVRRMATFQRGAESQSVTLKFHLDQVFDETSQANVSIYDIALTESVDRKMRTPRQSKFSRAMRRFSKGFKKTDFENKNQLRARQAGLVHPRSSNKFIFDIFVFIAILYLAFVVPLDIIFDIEPMDIHYLLFWVSRMLDTLFITDLILNFFTALDSGNGIELIVDKKEIASRYLHSWFLIDLVSSIPFDLLLWSTSASIGGNGGLVRTTRLFRFTKIIRVIKILRVMTE